VNRIAEARAVLAKAARRLEGKPDDGASASDLVDEAIALVDLEQEEREKVARGERIEDASRPEWRDGWPRGTWVGSFGVVFEVGAVGRDSEGSAMYLIPANLFGVDSLVSRYVAVYAALVNEARLEDGRVFFRRI
jgi:hypothetical protein